MDRPKNIAVWNYKNALEVAVMQGPLETAQAAFKASMFETERPVADMKQMIKSSFVEIQFPILSKLINHDASTLQCKIEKLLRDVIPEKVAVPLDKLKTWTIEEFMYSLFKCSLLVLEASQHPSKGFAVTLCTQEEDKFTQACKLMDLYTTGETGWVRGPLQVKGPPPKEIKISVTKGSLEEMETDALICTLAADYHLQHSATSKALLKAAGHELEQELLDKCPYKLNHGDIAVVQGYKLQCRHVLFGILKPYEPHRGHGSTGAEDYYRMSVQDFMQNCLQKAADLGLKTLAFPAIGSGHLKLPVQIVAEEMFQAVRIFSEKYSHKSIEHVTFVVFHGDLDACQVFQDMETKFSRERSGHLTDVYAAEASSQSQMQFDDRSSTYSAFDNGAQPYTNKASGNGASADTGARPKQKTDNLLTDSGREHKNKTDFSFSKNAKNVKVYQIKKVTVKVYCADILKLPVDCIVNAADGMLGNKRGLSKFIAQGAGKQLVEECTSYIKKKSILLEGQVMSTNAGRLPYKKIIHAVGPKWHTTVSSSEASVKKCEETLEKTITNILKQADNLAQTSVGLPSISAGSHSCPKLLCAKQYAKAVCKYCRRASTSLQEIHFVDKNEEMVREIQKAFDHITRDKRLPWEYESCNFVDIGARTNTTFKGPNAKPTMTRESTDIPSTSAGYPSWSETASGNFCCHLAPQKKLTVHTGDLLKVKKDMIACSEIPSGQGLGFLSKQLLSKCGESYRAEKQKEFRKAEYGDVVITTGGVSGYKYVAHVILFQKKDTNGEQDRQAKTESVFQKLFESMHAKNCTSLALPVLATGKNKGKVDYYTERFFKGLQSFCINPKYQHFKMEVSLVNEDSSKTTEAIETIKKLAGTSPIVPRPQRAPYRHRNHGTPQIQKDSPFKPFEKEDQDHLESSSDEPEMNTSDTARHGNIWEKSTDISSNTAFNASEANSTKKPKGNLMIFDETIDTVNSDTGSEKSDDSISQETEVERQSFCDPDMAEEETEDCVICMDTLNIPKTLPCGHKFCTDCIKAQFVYKEACPTCGAVCGVITGDQPEGKMDVLVSKSFSCAGYEGYGRIQITYIFPSGVQEKNHPSPGTYYKGITRSAYLPDNKRGQEILEMLKVAFERKLVFTIGNSRTTGQQGVITWNDIHHKTDPKPDTQFGYPDPTYLDRVVDELKAKGVTEADIKPKKERKSLDF